MEFIPGTVYMAIIEMKDPSKPPLELPVFLLDVLDEGIAEVVGFDIERDDWDPEYCSFPVYLDNLNHDRGRAFAFIERARWGLNSG
jgi:hypothetical protein